MGKSQASGGAGLATLKNSSMSSLCACGQHTVSNEPQAAQRRLTEPQLAQRQGNALLRCL